MNLLKYILFFLPVVLMLGSCEKDAEPAAVSIGMQLEEPLHIGRTYVRLKARVTSQAALKETGFLWWKTGDREHASEVACQDSLSYGLQVLLEGLEPDASYEYCLYAGNGTDRLMGEPGSFNTLLYGDPLLSDLQVDGEVANLFTFRVKDDGIDGTGHNLLSKGVCWNTEGSPTIDDRKQEAEGEETAFTVSIPDLQENTTYYLRAFALNDSSYLAYSPEITIHTGKTLPRISGIQLLDSLKKEFCATLEDIGGAEIISRGFCWNTTGMPTVEDEKEIVSDDFTGMLTNLKSNTLYYVRAFAENAFGIGYSEELAVSIVSLPIVGTVVRIDPENNVFRSVLVTDGGSEITEKGFCWNMTGNPSVGDHVVVADEDFTAMISEMESGTYYIRAYAVNKAGVGYGEELSVSIHVLTIPVLDRVRIIDWETNRIQCSILNVGGSKITANGFCWSTHDYPDVSDYLLDADEDFTAVMGTMYPGVYYIRAYASNKVGTGYSRTLVLDTRKVPEVGEIEVLNAATYTYRSRLLDNGGGNISKWGFCWNTVGEPDIWDDSVQADNDFTATLGELSPGVYYIRAYAINEKGAGYGPEYSIVVSPSESY
ncbi:hypothetical protein [Parabacteroides faecis]|uniref:Fibronectin type III domain protein n=1 Tax=Parabacteroides faecis TaxID=1217282 RepID=A0ABR6KT75_9BACT|nr:hypothetical protein [Parabacteroides faecis]MBB4624013.1 hypothetical protein [Parabacteroides faecis]